MVYNKLMKVCIVVSLLAFIFTDAVFANTQLGAETGNIIIDQALVWLIRIQQYSWPFAVILLIYAMYQYYVVGSEAFEYKVNGQKKIMGVCIVMSLIQCAPLIYAFATIGLN